MMKALVRDLLPHAPQHGLYVVPEIPEAKLTNALRDFGRGVDPSAVLALYDATLLGTGRDGALFLGDRIVFQNSDLEPVQHVRYEDIVEVRQRKKLIGGSRIELTVNRGRATMNLKMDFSGKPGAAEYVVRFLNEAMMHESVAPADTHGATTDWDAVRNALDSLVESGLLTPSDRARVDEVLRSR